jgi:hypothetical protein
MLNWINLLVMRILLIYQKEQQLMNKLRILLLNLNNNFP